MVAKAIIARVGLLATFLPVLPCTAQPVQIRVVQNPIGANGKPCVGFLLSQPSFSRQEKKKAGELAERAGQYAPLTYRDAATGTLFYVESDGQHLSAIGKDGKLIWTKSWNMCPYHADVPHIISMNYAPQPKPGDYAAAIMRKWSWLTNSPVIAVYFDSTQFGLVNQRTGDFFLEGQN